MAARQGSRMVERGVITQGFTNWTAIALEKNITLMCRNSRVIFFVSIAKPNDRCLCYCTAAMLVPLSIEPPLRLHTRRYKFGR